ncbi:MAG: hypothetical protein ABI548_11045 [Polyangiaceae bacterium]
MVETLNIKLLAPCRTSDPLVLRSVLGALDAEPLCEPTHANIDERMRLPYDRASATDFIRQMGGRTLILWRANTPKYTGWLNCQPVPVNDLKLDYVEPRQALLPELFNGATRVASLLQVEYGFVHMHWDRQAESLDYDSGIRMSVRDLNKYGLSGIHARTWFGPYLVELLGKAFLLSLPLATETSWGGVQLDLEPKPWLADFETLKARHAELMARLCKTGLVGTFQGAPVTWKAGPRWVAPGWDVRS